MQSLVADFSAVKEKLLKTYSENAEYVYEVDKEKFQETFRAFYETAKQELDGTLFTRFFNASVSASEGNMNGLLDLMKVDQAQSLNPYVEQLFKAVKTEIKAQPK